MFDMDDSIKMIVSAKDENEAVRGLIRYEDEIKSHYINVFHYRINDELEFEAKFLRLKAASKEEQGAELAREIRESFRSLWHSQHVSEPSKDSSGTEFAAHCVLADMNRVADAIAQNDGRTAALFLNTIWSTDCADDDGYFRRSLADLSSDADLFKIQTFEGYLYRVARARRYLARIEDELEQHRPPNDLEVLGLDVAKEYLTEEYSPVRMQWLTDFILVLIFDALLLAAKVSLTRAGPFVRFRARRDVAIWMTNLMLFRNELASRMYDPKEMLRRLRQFEDAKGTYVIPSLVYPLLESQERKAKTT